MAQPRVFIDGDAGTTGLRLREWLAGRDDFEWIRLDESRRKDPDARRSALERADLAILCLPDDAAREAVAWAEGGPRILDASSAHRVADGFEYGLPELDPARRDAIRTAARVSNPGCHATGAVLCLRPLVDAGIVAPDAPLFVRSLSGYSGGGRALIERYEADGAALCRLPADAPYALDVAHKHLPEMTRYAGLVEPPQFAPAVGPFRCGMRIEIPLHARLLKGGATARQVWEVYRERYAEEPFVVVAPWVEQTGRDEPRFDPRACNDTNEIELSVFAHPAGHVWLMARLDNLGKGAAGAAIQNLNLMLGVDETRGLRD